MKYPLVHCEKHGQNLPGYCVCLHVANGAEAVRVVFATEKELGEAVCVDCSKRELTVDDLILVCAGCFAGMRWEVKH